MSMRFSDAQMARVERLNEMLVCTEAYLIQATQCPISRGFYAFQATQ